MKTNKYFLTAFGFLAGAALGISFIGILSFSSGPGNPGSGITPVSPTEANAYFKKYMVDAPAYNQVIKGFTIDKSQLDAMNSIAKENTGLVGFRIYMGKDNSARKAGIVVGVDSNGKDLVTNTIYYTSAPNLNACPPVCDVASPIIRE